MDREEWKPDRRSYEIAKAAAKLYLTQCKQGTQVKITDFTLPEPPKEIGRPRQKELPPLELMKLPPDHPQVIQTKLRWNALLHPPRGRRRG